MEIVESTSESSDEVQALFNYKNIGFPPKSKARAFIYFCNRIASTGGLEWNITLENAEWTSKFAYSILHFVLFSSDSF